MNKKDIHQHCAEVEKLMRGKTPFVTRWGVTLIVAVLAIIFVILLVTDGISNQLMKEIIEHTSERIKIKAF
ncbi:MAG: hypothetical protein HUK03_00260 [Bacteroidaceae bacterium]|nr:hypothetical protein [Bacteroidaceae bacterium]